MTETVTAFNHTFTIHPEYYHNSTSVTTNPEYVISGTNIISMTLVMASHATFFAGASLCLLAGFDLTAKNLLLSTAGSTISSAAFTATAASIAYPDETFESFVHNLKVSLPYAYDYTVFTAEYARDNTYDYLVSSAEYVSDYFLGEATPDNIDL